MADLKSKSTFKSLFQIRLSMHLHCLWQKKKKRSLFFIKKLILFNHFLKIFMSNYLFYIIVGPEIWGSSPLCVKSPKPKPRSPTVEDTQWKLLEGPRMWPGNLKKMTNSVQEQYKGESCQHRNVEPNTWQAHTPNHAIQLFPTTPNHSDVWIDRTSNYPKEGKTDT